MKDKHIISIIAFNKKVEGLKKIINKHVGYAEWEIYNELQYLLENAIPLSSEIENYFSLEDIIAFTEWCNHPVYRLSGDLAFKKRVTPQFPEYNTYMVNDENGKSIFPSGKFLTTEELIELWKQNKTQ